MADKSNLLAIQKVKHAASDPSSETILLNQLKGVWDALALLATELDRQAEPNK